MLHLISEQSDINKMNPENLAIVFGQNLIRSNTEDLMKVLFSFSSFFFFFLFLFFLFFLLGINILSLSLDNGRFSSNQWSD